MPYFDQGDVCNLLNKVPNVIAVLGAPMTGKATVCQWLAKNLGYKIMNMKQIGEEITRKRLSKEDEPFEGDVPLDEIKKDTLEIVAKDR